MFKKIILFSALLLMCSAACITAGAMQRGDGSPSAWDEAREGVGPSRNVGDASSVYSGSSVDPDFSSALEEMAVDSDASSTSSYTVSRPASRTSNGTLAALPLVASPVPSTSRRSSTGSEDVLTTAPTPVVPAWNPYVSPLCQDCAAMDAAEQGNLDSLKMIVQIAGPDVLLRRAWRRTDYKKPLTAAIQHRHLLKYIATEMPHLLEVSIHGDGRTAAFYAPDVESLQIIVDHAPSGANSLNVEDKFGGTLAHSFAFKEKDLEKLHYVVQTAPQGTQLLLKSMNSGGLTPGIAALIEKNLKALQYCIQLVGTRCLEVYGYVCLGWYRVDERGLPIVEYLATLSDRRILFREMDEPFGGGAIRTLIEYEEELEAIQRSLQVLLGDLFAREIFTPAQKAALGAGEPLDVTPKQLNHPSVLPFLAVNTVVLPMTQKRAQMHRSAIREALAARRGQAPMESADAIIANADFL